MKNEEKFVIMPGYLYYSVVAMRLFYIEKYKSELNILNKLFNIFNNSNLLLDIFSLFCINFFSVICRVQYELYCSPLDQSDSTYFGVLVTK